MRAAVLLFALVAVAAPAPGTKFFVTGVHFEGLKRVGPSEATKLAAIHLGATVNLSIMEEAAARLTASGLFTSVASRYSSTGDDLRITFRVVEAPWDVPVRFDNLVWFSDGELRKRIAASVPGFDGSAPRTGMVLATIRETLERALAEKGIAGRVEHRLSVEPIRHVYRVEGISLPVCDVMFPGASDAAATELARAAAPIKGEPYSIERLTELCRVSLVDVYRNRAQWRARFREPSGTLANEGTCVRVSIPVEEGPELVWEGATWTGNEAISSDELQSLLGMKVGEPAIGSKIDAGLVRVEEAYARLGFLDVVLSREERTIGVREGPRYRMGNLHVTGLSESDAALLTRAWKIEAGAPFDRSYPPRFIETIAREPFWAALGRNKVGWSMKTDREQRTVDVVVEFR